MAENHENQLLRIRHSASHVMAQAVLEIFPEGKFAIGPATDDGFYYDFDLPRPLTPEDLEKIEGRMREIIKGKHPFTYQEVSADQARTQFKDQPYKLELIENLQAGEMDEDGNPTGEPVKISFYTHGDFTDLCRGPHVENTSQINPDAIKLLSIAGAYWRGSEKNPMLQRIYGTAFETAKDLEEYLVWREEVEKRDHRKLGKQLDLFSVNPDLGGGLILWHPKGGMIRHLAEEFCKNEHLAGGYDLVYSPHIGRAHLWETSGHLTWYKENMYSSMDIEGQDYYLKPMNCPFHILMYKNSRRSYRDLPMRYAEWGTVYRFERGGVLHGLLRVRGFTQDDAHLFCRPDQMPEEIDRVLGFCLHILRSFGFTDFHAYLSTRDPEKSAGDPELWVAPTEALRDALIRADIPFAVDEGGAAFYGPKIDIKIKDALGREWQLSTIQFDFNLPERFDMTYIGEDGQEHRPYMIHRALLGSMERFFGVLIEHYGGAFPVWLAPVQAMIIPIADRHLDFAHEIVTQLKAAGIRVEIDQSANRMQAKIRDAQNQKIPYMLVVGDREAAEGAVNVRLRTGEQKGTLSIPEFKAYVQDVVARKDLI
ncbi:MAG TPA: threonine--tRNA ligase [Anaerolineales bacterium]|nr:threonine--tRNA ligase [Anaerolineales bacterium]